jgi:hypothetical protein
MQHRIAIDQTYDGQPPTNALFRPSPAHVVWRKTDGTEAVYDTSQVHFGQPVGGATGSGI